MGVGWPILALVGLGIAGERPGQRPVTGVDGVVLLKNAFFENIVSKTLIFFEKSRIVYFTPFFIIFVTRNLFEKDAPRYYLSDGQQIFKNLLNGAKLWPNYWFFKKGNS